MHSSSLKGGVFLPSVASIAGMLLQLPQGGGGLHIHSGGLRQEGGSIKLHSTKSEGSGGGLHIEKGGLHQQAGNISCQNCAAKHQGGCLAISDGRAEGPAVNSSGSIRAEGCTAASGGTAHLLKRFPRNDYDQGGDSSCCNREVAPWPSTAVYGPRARWPSTAAEQMNQVRPMLCCSGFLVRFMWPLFWRWRNDDQRQLQASHRHHEFQWLPSRRRSGLRKLSSCWLALRCICDAAVRGKSMRWCGHSPPRLRSNQWEHALPELHC